MSIKRGKGSKKRTTKRKVKKPEWCTKLLVDERETLNALKFYDIFGITMDPILGSIRSKLIAGGSLTLEDQKLVTRCLCADIAKRTHRVFQRAEYDGLAVECADSLRKANT